jgi:hypothetical protein
MRAVWLVAILACSTREAPIVLKDVDQLGEADRHELVKVRGVASGIQARGGSRPAHISFTLSHGDRSVTVVTKDVLPDLFREHSDVVVTGRYVRAEEVRAALDTEGFGDVTGDVFLARDVFVRAIEFQF